MYSHSVFLSNSVVTGCKPKVVRFLRVQISDGFRRTRTLYFVIPLSQHSLHLICKMCTKTSPSHQSLHHLLISLRPELKAATASGNSHPLLGDMGPAEPQTVLRVVDILDLYGTPAFPAPPPPQRKKSKGFKSGLFGGQASDLMYRRQTWSRYSADCCLIASQPAETGEALADRQ